MHWFRYKLYDRQMDKTMYFDSATHVNLFLGFKSVTPIQAYFKKICLQRSRKTKARWARYKLEKCFVIKVGGDSRTIDRKIRALNKKTHAEIRGLLKTV